MIAWGEVLPGISQILTRHVGTGPVGPALAGPLFGNIKIEAQFSINEW